MKILVIFLVVGLSATDINKITRINNAKRAGQEAYKNGNMEAAISSFRLLTDSLGVDEDPVLLNLANAYFQQKDTTNAAQYYAKVLTSDDDNLRSLAYQQIGVINQQQNKLEKALSDFKNALRSNPQNADARYNYELLKKTMKEQEQKEQNKDDDIKPSEYAKKLKAQADILVNQNMFEQAAGIMQKGLQEDKTVAAYNAFISKLNDVVESKQ